MLTSEISHQLDLSPLDKLEVVEPEMLTTTKPHPTVYSEGGVMREYLVPISALKPLIEEVTVSYRDITTSKGAYNLVERVKVKGFGIFERKSWSEGCLRNSNRVYFPKYILLETTSDFECLPQEVQDQVIDIKHSGDGDRGVNADRLELIKRLS